MLDTTLKTQHSQYLRSGGYNNNNHEKKEEMWKGRGRGQWQEEP